MCLLSLLLFPFLLFFFLCISFLLLIQITPPAVPLHLETHSDSWSHQFQFILNSHLFFIFTLLLSYLLSAYFVTYQHDLITVSQTKMEKKEILFLII